MWWGMMLRSTLMATDHILALLIAERDKLNRAIDALQGPVKRRWTVAQESHDSFGGTHNR